MTIYRDWFPLDKHQFRIMVMLSVEGKFRGMMADILRYFSVSPQSKNRNKIKNAIGELIDKGFITFRQTAGSNTFEMELIPREEESAVEVKDDIYLKIRERGWTEEVAWEPVLKVYAWIADNQYEKIIRNRDIENDTSLSPTVICSAKNVLDRFLNSIERERLTKLVEGEFRTIGQHIGASAFWYEE